MSEQPEQRVIQVQLGWPQDTYVDAEPANAFVFNDLGENVCLAFGFAPPPPGIEQLAQGDEFQLEIQRKRALLIPKSLFATLIDQLNTYRESNPQMFAAQVVSDAPGTSDQG